MENEKLIELIVDVENKLISAYPYTTDEYRIKQTAEHLIANGVTVQKHGRWEWRGRDKGYFCSNCGSGCLLNYESDWHKSDYCPHCGALMDKKLLDEIVVAPTIIK